MADMMAIISKAVFERAAGKSPAVGTRLRMDRYVSANKALDKLSAGGKLYLVTVRPPDEALWLVAVLDRPKFDGEQWVAKPCDTPITDIGGLKKDLVFESGKGLKAAPSPPPRPRRSRPNAKAFRRRPRASSRPARATAASCCCRR